jgi:asparagine synthase (glutamine-hydrolysing)
MCGIAAIFKKPEVRCDPAVLDRMRDTVAYRGPDDKGSVLLAHAGSPRLRPVAADGAWEVGLAHRRLSILDLSPAGHQPMVYRGAYWIVYNGEVYNFVELRRELARLGHNFKSTSDTEVILAGYAEWGADCFARFRGMWAMIIIDTLRGEAVLSRDRLGIKPAYFWQSDGLVAVASEIKQFQQLPGFSARADAVAAAEYLNTGYEDPSRTFFRGVRPVPAAHWIKFPLETLTPQSPVEYWKPERVQVSVSDPAEAGRLFLNKARECVAMHLRSDVPVGCALSGGLDSSAIAALMADSAPKNHEGIHTFTVTFPGHAIDEREYAELVASTIQAAAHYVTPDPGTFLEEMDDFLWTHDEPIGGLSLYAGYCVARLTNQAGIKVTLNGQGGDEIFSGYWQSYFLYLRELWKDRSLLSLFGHFAGAAAAGNPLLLAQLPQMARRYYQQTRSKLRLRLPESVSQSRILAEILVLSGQARRVFEVRTMHLPRLLKWDDRNSMAFSVEGRYPLLDHELIELCLSFAPHTLYRSGWTKYPLRLGMRNTLPAKVLQRRTKFGFETPQQDWMRGPLRPMLEKWLTEDRPIWDYVVRQDAETLARETWSNNNNGGSQLLRLMMFDRWLEIFNVRC